MDKKLLRALNILAVIGIIFLLLAYGRRIASLLTPVLIAALLTLLLLPLIDFLAKKLRFRLAAVLIVLLPAFGGIAWIVWWAISQLYSEAERYVLSFPEIIASLQSLFNTRILPLVRGTRYEETFFIILDDVVLQAVSWLQSLAKGLVSSGITLVSALPGLFLAFMVTVLLVFYSVYDKKWVYGFIPMADESINKVLKSVYGFIKSQLMLIVITAAICMLTFSLLKIPYVFILGIVAAIFDLLPVLGTGTLLVPMVAWYFILGKPFTAIMLGVLYAVIVVVRQIVEPRLLSNNLGIHPVAAILSVYFGLKLFGPIGLVLLPLIVSIAASFPQFKWLRR